MARLYRRSPLQMYRLNDMPAKIHLPGLKIAEMAPVGKLLLQGKYACLKEELEAAAGISLPVRVNQVISVSGKFSCLKLRPDQWLWLAEDGEFPELRAGLENRLGGLNAYVTNVTDKYLGIAVAGKYAASLLAVGCSLNFDDHSFIPGSCAQSLIDQVPVIIHKLPEANTYQIFVERNLAYHQWNWFCQVSLEFSSNQNLSQN